MSTTPERRSQLRVLTLGTTTHLRLVEPASTDAAAPVCPTCKGAHFLVADVPYGHPRFGELIPCPCTQAERQQRHQATLEQLSNLGDFRDQTFATFDPDVPGVRKAFLRAHTFAQQPQGWLLLFGPYGVGKTHLAAAAANQVLDRGEPVLFAVVPDLLDHLRATFGPTSEVGYDARFEQVRSAGLLILDDLGTESATGWAREKLYQILNHRYNASLPTVITSNRALDTLDGRIVSRMHQQAFGGEILRISAEDYRKQLLKWPHP